MRIFPDKPQPQGQWCCRPGNVLQGGLPKELPTALVLSFAAAGHEVCCHRRKHANSYELHINFIHVYNTSLQHIYYYDLYKEKLGKEALAGLLGSLCEPGYFQSKSGATLCEPCAPGTFDNSSGTTSCTVCFIGFYQSQEAMDSCEACPAERSTLLLAAKSQEDCVCRLGYIIIYIYHIS